MWTFTLSGNCWLKAIQLDSGRFEMHVTKDQCFKFQHAGAAHKEVLHYASRFRLEPLQFIGENEYCGETTREALNKPVENMILHNPKVQLFTLVSFGSSTNEELYDDHCFQVMVAT